jgi:hypothetical protein
VFAFAISGGNAMRAVPRLMRLTLILMIGCALFACGGGSGSTSSSSTSSSSHSSSGSGGGTPPPPALNLFFFWVGSGPPVTGNPWPWVTQGSGNTGVVLTVSIQAASGVQLADLQTAVFDSSGKQVTPTAIVPLPRANNGNYLFNPTVQVPVENPGLYTIECWVTDPAGGKAGPASATLQVVATSTYATVVTETGPDPLSLTLSNGTLYWAESGENALKSAPVSGGPAKVLATRMLNPSSVVFSGSNVIWLDDRDGTVASCTASSITRVLKQTNTSGFSSVLASGPSCSGGASQIALIGATVYWVSSTTSPATWVINAVPLSGAAATAVRTTTTPIVALTANAGTLYWMENPYPNGAATIFALTPGGTVTTVASGFTADANTFAVASSAVYYATPNVPATTPPTETLWAQPLAGGAAQALATAISTPVKLLSTLPLGGSSIVWIDQTAVNSVPATGGAVTQLGSVSGTPVDLLYDGTNVRWSELTANMGQYGETGMIESVPLGGGAVTTVYQGGDAPRELAEDPQGRLNWTEGGPVGITEGFARIARIGSTGSVESVVTGVNAAYTLSRYLSIGVSGSEWAGIYQYPTSLPLAATSTSLLVADQWRIKALPLTGGQLTTIAAPDGGLIAALATDGTSVYWDDGTSSLSKAPVTGGTITALVPPSVLGGYAGPGGPIVLASDGMLDWAIDDQCNLPASACSSVSIASAPSAAPSTSLNVLASKYGFVPSLAVNSTALFVPDPPNISIHVIGTTNITVGWQPVFPTATALDSSALYWTASFFENQWIVYKDSFISPNALGQSLLLFLESSPGNPLDLALDSNYVYFADGQLIRKTPK